MSAVSLFDQAKLVGAYCWIESRMFEIAGSWVVDEPSAEARILFDALSQQHAWHAGLFSERLPVLKEVDHDALASAPSAVLERFADEVEKAEGTPARLGALARVVLPRLLTAYDQHLKRVLPVTDEPLTRVLELVVSDETKAWMRAEGLLEGLASSARTLEEMTGALCSLEAVVSELGPGLGLWAPASLPGA